MNNDNKALVALKQHIGFTQEPPDIDTAIESEYYLKNVLPLKIYPFWRKRLRELYPDNITTKSTYVLATGSIGGGKSTFAQIIILYDIIKMACMRDIREFAGIGMLQGAFCKCANITKTKSQDFVDTLINAVFGGHSPFFQRELERGNWFLNHLHLQATGAREKELVSNDVPLFWISECNQLRPEIALRLVSSCDSRLTSRFINCENICTHLIVDSSTVGVDAATEALLESDPKFSSDNAFIVKVNSWNVVEGLNRYFNYGSFWVYCGDSQTNPFIVPKEDLTSVLENGEERFVVSESLKMKYDPDRFLECPNELLPEAERDITLFLQEKAGVSTTSGSKFFTDQARLAKAFKIEQNVDDVIRVDFFDPYDTIMAKLFKDVSLLPVDRKLFIKIDCGLSHDLFGVAIAYADGVERNVIDGADVDRLRIRIPICFALSRYNSQETPINKIEDFILQLNQTHNVAMVLTDNYQSSELRQVMIQNGVQSKLQSVDRTDGPYIIFKNYIYSGLVELPNNALLKKEIGELEHRDNRVDHPTSGCFIGDTLVKVKRCNGDISEVPLESLIGNEHLYKVLSYSDKGFYWNEIVRVWETKKVTTLIKLDFEDSSYYCTPEHLILTNRGWVKASELTDGEEIIDCN